MKQVKRSKIKENPNNPRIIKDHKYYLLVKSLQEFPEMLKLRPIVVDEDMMVLGGNKRLKASKDAGLKEVWIEIAEGLTEAQKKEFVIKDNTNYGEWDWDILANEWDSVQLTEWGVDAWPNQDDIKVEPIAGLTDEDAVPDVPDDPVTVEGDVWLLGNHRLLCGDATKKEDVERLMDGQKADMVFTDPPYGVEYSGRGKKTKKKIINDNLKGDELYDFLIKAFENMSLATKGGSVAYVFHADSKKGIKSSFENAFWNAGWHLSATIIWAKKQASMGWQDYRSQHEPILYGFKQGQSHQFYGDRTNTTLWHQGRDSNYEHPTQKPIELAKRGLSNSSKTDDVILDLFLGSGSTLIACEKTNRKCYGMEIDPHYCDVIVKRWEE